MRTKINKKSDFDFIVLDSEGNPIPFPTDDFSLFVWTWGSKCRFKASSIKGVLTGCKNEDNKLRVYVDNPGFVPGKLVGELVTYITNDTYNDGSQRTCRYISDFGIDMVNEDSETNEVQVLAMMQYIQGASAYEIACEYGYQGTEEEWLASLSLDSRTAADECRDLMQSLSAAEESRDANEDLRKGNEVERITNEQTRASNEAERVAAEQARVAAETSREETFATYASTLAAKEDTTNKVTSLDNPSDSSFPTTKAIREWLEKGYQFMGIATPTTTPGTPDRPVFYLANEGIYLNFLRFVVKAGQIGIFRWNGSAWVTEAIDVLQVATNFNDPNNRTLPTTKAVWDIVSNQFWYGVEWDKTTSSPTCTRIGNMELHRTLPVQSQMRGCLLADDGTVNKYLNPDDWTGEDRDGSQGMVMVELPRYYRKFEEEVNRIRLKLSLLPLDGFHEVPKKYVSAYEAAIERSTGKLCSVVNEGTDYRGGANDSSWDGTNKSQLGMPVTNINRANFRVAARKRGSNSWNILTYDVYKDLYWLYVCEYATLNSQAAYNAELTTEGYRQGGLGAGLTTITSYDWHNLNGIRPLAKCGLSDYAGNKTAQHMLHLENDSGSIAYDVAIPRYRGIEHLFGNIYKIADGVNVVMSPTVANGGDDTSKVYVCDNPDNFSDTNINFYRYAGLEARQSGYVKQMAVGEHGDIVPTICSGASSTTYYCDNHYTSINKAQILSIWLFGGAAIDNTNAGLAYIRSGDTASVANTAAGSRLCFIPNK